MPYEVSPDAVAFDNVPEIYDRARPSYPEPLFDDLWARLVTPGPEIVEIGPGTGKATRSLLERGATVTAVEPGRRMAEFLREKFAAAYGERLRVVNSPFEAAELALAAFDIVFAATSFHWVDPAVRLSRAHEVLRAAGIIAIVSTNQIRSDADRGFFDRVQPIYRKYFPDEARDDLPGEDVVPAEFAEIDGSLLFGSAELLRYRWDQSYATEQWADLVRSFSNTQVMEAVPREGLIADLSSFIDREYGGSITRPLVMTLTFARRSEVG